MRFLSTYGPEAHLGVGNNFGTVVVGSSLQLAWQLENYAGFLVFFVLLSSLWDGTKLYIYIFIYQIGHSTSHQEGQQYS